MMVNLGFLGGDYRRNVVLPYRSDASFAELWPAGFRTAKDAQANPGARTIDTEAGIIFPAAGPGTHLRWQASFQSNLYSIRLPE